MHLLINEQHISILCPFCDMLQSVMEKQKSLEKQQNKHLSHLTRLQNMLIK